MITPNTPSSEATGKVSEYSLKAEIEESQRLVRADAYQLSIGEVVNMYDNEEIVINPEFQRLFRWSNSQKSKFIESLLLGIPVPSIFVFEREDASWELIDGLQRLSTILEFMGKLKVKDGIAAPSILDATTYLPSLYNTVWEASEAIGYVPLQDQRPLAKDMQLAIRRARIGVEILKRPSDNKTKFDLFQRLNAGGTQANAQEVRNCIMLMTNPDGYRQVKRTAELDSFIDVLTISDDQKEKQRHMEYAVRFLVHYAVAYDGKLDIEEFMDSGIVTLLGNGKLANSLETMSTTFSLLNACLGSDALKRWDGEKHVGKVGLVGLEGISVGVAKNLASIVSRSDSSSYLQDRIKNFWLQDEVSRFTLPGLRGTTRIQRTVPFGETWFHQ
jgi:Uncharacterized conserved protein